MNRRDLLKGALVAGATLAVPAKLAAMPMKGTLRDRRLFEIAKRELDRAGGAIWQRDRVGISDFGLHSALPRFHIVNLEQETVESYHVSHGQGSDYDHDGWLNEYSNVEGSNATSRGAYVTWEWYQGKYGTSVRLGGLDPTNEAALRRYIVMHPAAYAEPRNIEAWGRLGRSNGCFALGSEQFKTALMKLSGGRLLYADSLGLHEDGSIAIGPPAEPAPQLGWADPEEPDFSQASSEGTF